MGLLSRLFGPAGAPQVREARAGDAGDLARLHAASFHRGWGADEFERMLAERVTRAHVLTSGARGAPLGFVVSHVVVPESEILSIAVAPAARGQGGARLLLAHHLARLAATGVGVSHLEVEEGNAAALALYRRLGYAETGRRKGYYREGGQAMDAILMRRTF